MIVFLPKRLSTRDSQNWKMLIFTKQNDVFDVLNTEDNKNASPCSSKNLNKKIINKEINKH